MRIWLAPSAYAPHKGGVEELTAQLARQLSDRGHELRVVTHRHPDDLPTDEFVAGIEVSRLHFASPSRHLSALAGLGPSVRAGIARLDALPRPDVIHIQCASNQTALLTAWSRLRRVPLVLTTQGETVMDAGQIYQRSRWLRTVLRTASRRAAALTACSAWTLGQVTAIAPAFAAASVIPNGVTAGDWAVGRIPAEPVLAAWGRHVPQKGFDLLLDAFDVLLERRPQARLLLGGAGPETARLQARAGSAVEFVGPLDRAGVRSLLARARVGVVPSRIEPFGIVALETLAAGRQLAYSSGTGLAEAAGPHGVAVNVADRVAFATALERALAAPLDKAAVAPWLAEHSWSAIADAYEAVYARL